MTAVHYTSRRRPQQPLTEARMLPATDGEIELLLMELDRAFRKHDGGAPMEYRRESCRLLR
ncbi:MAG: hypothetical protein A3K46_04595 [Chloroflexi bacterium RBG_13_60_9]|nr:MAG: hypothetical protein A3K46_04595 [Chloroflexi bacterium RBG_13_60_9]